MNVLDQISTVPASWPPLKFPIPPDAPAAPISIYQVQLNSWMRVPEENYRPLAYGEIAPKLAAHAAEARFTHVQLIAPDNTDVSGFKFLVETLHRGNLGVIVETPSLARPTQDPALYDLGDGLSVDGETVLHEHHYHWDLAWPDEMAAYFSTDPLYRKYRQHQFVQRDQYAFTANYILPLSQRLASRLGKSLLSLMPGDPWRQFANLRLLFAYQFALPGKKLIFMGNEFGQPNAWRPDSSLDWHLLQANSFHGKLLKWVTHLNRFYGEEGALHQTDSRAAGFQWVDTSDATCSVISLLRKSEATNETLLVVLNFTPVPRQNYRVGVPMGGLWREALNSDALEFGGSGQGNLGGVEAAPFGWNSQSHSLTLTLPPLGAIFLKASL
ncbi:MAG TPA: alpha amylase C-terminal domain-containing protein [Verrucomicrobiae bacterium]